MANYQIPTDYPTVKDLIKAVAVATVIDDGESNADTFTLSGVTRRFVSVPNRGTPQAEQFTFDLAPATGGSQTVTQTQLATATQPKLESVGSFSTKADAETALASKPAGYMAFVGTKAYTKAPDGSVSLSEYKWYADLAGALSAAQNDRAAGQQDVIVGVRDDTNPQLYFLNSAGDALVPEGGAQAVSETLHYDFARATAAENVEPTLAELNATGLAQNTLTGFLRGMTAEIALSDGRLETWAYATSWRRISIVGGSQSFTGLTDTPAGLTGLALRILRVNAAETALEAEQLAASLVAFDNATATLAGNPATTQAAIEALKTLVDGQPTQVSVADFASLPDPATVPNASLYHVTDASGDTNVSAGWAKYQALSGAWFLYLSQESLNVLTLSTTQMVQGAGDTDYDNDVAGLVNVKGLDAFLHDRQSWIDVTADDTLLVAGKNYRTFDKNVTLEAPSAANKGKTIGLWSYSSTLDPRNPLVTLTLKAPNTYAVIPQFASDPASVLFFTSNGSEWEMQFLGVNSSVSINTLNHNNIVLGLRVFYLIDTKNGPMTVRLPSTVAGPIRFMMTSSSEHPLTVQQFDMSEATQRIYYVDGDGAIITRVNNSYVIDPAYHRARLFQITGDPLRGTWSAPSLAINTGSSIPQRRSYIAEEEITASTDDNLRVATAPAGLTEYSEGTNYLVQPADGVSYPFPLPDISTALGWENAVTNNQITIVGEAFTNRATVLYNSSVTFGIDSQFRLSPGEKQFLASNDGTKQDLKLTVNTSFGKTVTVDGQVVTPTGSTVTVNTAKAWVEVTYSSADSLSGQTRIYTLDSSGDESQVIQVADYTQENLATGAHPTSPNAVFVPTKNQSQLKDITISFRDRRPDFDNGVRDTGAETFTLAELTTGKAGWTAEGLPLTSGGLSGYFSQYKDFAVDGTSYRYWVRYQPTTGGSLFRFENTHSGQVNTYGGYKDFVATFDPIVSSAGGVIANEQFIRFIANGSSILPGSIANLSFPASETEGLSFATIAGDSITFVAGDSPLDVEAHIFTRGTAPTSLSLWWFNPTTNDQYGNQAADGEGFAQAGNTGQNSSKPALAHIPANTTVTLSLRHSVSSQNQVLQAGSFIKITERKYLGQVGYVLESEVAPVEEDVVTLINVDATDNTLYSFGTGETWAQIKAKYAYLIFTGNASQSGTPNVRPYSKVLTPTNIELIAGHAGHSIQLDDSLNSVNIAINAPSDADTGFTYQQSSGDSSASGRMQFTVIGVKKSFTAHPHTIIPVETLEGSVAIPATNNSMQELGVQAGRGGKLELWISITGSLMDYRQFHIEIDDGNSWYLDMPTTARHTAPTIISNEHLSIGMSDGGSNMELQIQSGNSGQLRFKWVNATRAATTVYWRYERYMGN